MAQDRGRPAWHWSVCMRSPAFSYGPRPGGDWVGMGLFFCFSVFWMDQDIGRLGLHGPVFMFSIFLDDPGQWETGLAWVCFSAFIFLRMGQDIGG